MLTNNASFAHMHGAHNTGNGGLLSNAVEEDNGGHDFVIHLSPIAQQDGGLMGLSYEYLCQQDRKFRPKIQFL